MRISDWSSDVCSSDLVAGFEKVRAALRAGEVGLLVQAADGADDGRQKIQALARAVGPQVPLLQFCSAAELGAAVGREADRKSVVEGKSVAVRVDLGGRRIIKKKKQ